MNNDEFISAYSGLTEEYKFYDGSVILRYDKDNHLYYLLEGGEFVEIPSVTQICHIVDKSAALIPWACKVMAEQILDDIPTFEYEPGMLKVQDIPFCEFTKIVYNAKSAHTEKLEEAADIGHMAHAWIEEYIKGWLDVKEKLSSDYFDYKKEPLPENEKVKSCVTAALNWMQAHNVRWICTERKIYSKEHKYAGTLDGIAVVDSCKDKLCCKTDFKDHRSLIDWKSSNNLYAEYLLQSGAYQMAYQEETGEKLDDRWIIRLGKIDGEFDPWHTDAYDDDSVAFLDALNLSRSMDSIKDRMKIKKDWIKSEVKRVKKEEKTKEKEEEKRIKAEIRAKVKAEKEAVAKEKRKKKKEEI